MCVCMYVGVGGRFVYVCAQMYVSRCTCSHVCGDQTLMSSCNTIHFIPLRLTAWLEGPARELWDPAVCAHAQRWGCKHMTSHSALSREPIF